MNIFFLLAALSAASKEVNEHSVQSKCKSKIKSLSENQIIALAKRDIEKREGHGNIYTEISASIDSPRCDWFVYAEGQPPAPGSARILRYSPLGALEAYHGGK